MGARECEQKGRCFATYIGKLHCSESLEPVNNYIVLTHSVPANSVDTLPYINNPISHLSATNRQWDCTNTTGNQCVITIGAIPRYQSFHVI